MNCEELQARIMDVLYGEELDARLCYRFFHHLERCPACHREYLELLETREWLSDWTLDDSPEADAGAARSASFWQGVLNGRRWWSAVQKIAAGFLIVFGALAVLESAGFVGEPRMVVSEPQLSAMVHDMITAQQVDERQLMLRALLTVKEDLELGQRARYEQLQGYLLTLEQRYVENLEENNRYLRTLLSR